MTYFVMAEKEEHPFEEMQNKRIKMTLSIFIITVVTIAVFGAGGYLIDLYFDTKPIFLFALVIISFPVTQLLLYKRAQYLIKK